MESDALKAQELAMKSAPITDEDLLDELWDIASHILDVAYDEKHNADNTDEERLWAQGKADALRPMLLAMRGHSRYYNKPPHWNEHGGGDSWSKAKGSTEDDVTISLPSAETPIKLQTPEFEGD